MYSIIVPIYKVEKYLRKCVESILSQTYDDFELVLVDDGSPDSCPAICDEYAAKDSRIKVVHKSNGGLVAARKAGLECSFGNYVFFVDGDDWICKDCLEQINHIIERFAPDIVSFSDFYSATDDGAKRTSIGKRYNGVYDKARLSAEVYSDLFFCRGEFAFGITPSLWSKVIRRDIISEFLKNTSEDIRMGEDWVVTLPCMLAANSVFFTDICSYYYRKTPTSMTNSFDVSAPKRIASLLAMLRERIADVGVENINDQISLYAVFIVKFTLSNLVRGSSNIREDLKQFNILWEDPLLSKGIKLKIPFKAKVFLLTSKYKQVWILKLMHKLRS